METDIEIDDLLVHYEVTGKEGAPAVLLMHGWGCDHTTVRSIAAIMEPEMRVYNVDLPGHGESEEPPQPWGVDDFTRLMEKFVELLGLDVPVLVGHSFGGRIAIMMSSRNKVGKVLLVDAAGIKPRRSFKYFWKVYSFKALKKIILLLFGKKRGGDIVDWVRDRTGSADYRSSSPIMRAVMSRCVNEDLKHVMPSIKSPTLLVWGEDDPATPLSDAQKMVDLIPDAGLVALPGCGHYSFLDNPYTFKIVVRKFLGIKA